jgi:hypothetical protein
MGKKKKHRSRKQTTKSSPWAPKQKHRSKLPFIALAIGVVLFTFGVYSWYQAERTQGRSLERADLKNENIRLREIRLTLSPQKFSGKVRRSYEIARAIPEVLDQLYCYCRCRENFGHKNLLTCFVDTHAST